VPCGRSCSLINLVLPQTTANSRTERNDLDELLQWCHIAERLPRPAVEAAMDAGEIVGAKSGCLYVGLTEPLGWHRFSRTRLFHFFVIHVAKEEHVPQLPL